MSVKSFVLFSILLSISYNVSARRGITPDCIYNENVCRYPSKTKGVRDVAWVIPSRTPRINGLAFGLAAVPTPNHKQEINGVNIEADPIAFILLETPFYFVVGQLSQNRREYRRDLKKGINHLMSPVSDSFTDELINGVDINTCSFPHTANRGLSLNGIGTLTYQKGVAISVTLNCTNHFKGIEISPLANVNAYGKGVSFGLVNICHNCSGLQIGLINKNGKKATPFLSYRSRKKAQRLARNGSAVKDFFQ